MPRKLNPLTKKINVKRQPNVTYDVDKVRLPSHLWVQIKNKLLTITVVNEYGSLGFMSYFDVAKQYNISLFTLLDHIDTNEIEQMRRDIIAHLTEEQRDAFNAKVKVTLYDIQKDTLRRLDELIRDYEKKRGLKRNADMTTSDYRSVLKDRLELVAAMTGVKSTQDAFYEALINKLTDGVTYKDDSDESGKDVTETKIGDINPKLVSSD